MQYADYKYYHFRYAGKMIELEYERLSTKASAYLDQVTQGRINEAILGGRFGDKVKLACCTVADAYLLNEQGGGVTSETVGKHTKSYASIPLTDGQRLYQAASLYLAGTGLMYRGC